MRRPWRRSAMLIMEVPAEGNPSGAPAAGFGEGGKPDFWIGGEGGIDKPLHVAFQTRDRASVDAFHKAALAAGGRDNGSAPDCGRTTTRTTTGVRVSIPTATTSRPSATHRVERSQVEAGPFASPIGRRRHQPRLRARLRRRAERVG